jgi:hypothetical protein
MTGVPTASAFITVRPKPSAKDGTYLSNCEENSMPVFLAILLHLGLVLLQKVVLDTHQPPSRSNPGRTFLPIVQSDPGVGSLPTQLTGQVSKKKRA